MNHINPKNQKNINENENKEKDKNENKKKQRGGGDDIHMFIIIGAIFGILTFGSLAAKEDKLIIFFCALVGAVIGALIGLAFSLFLI